MGVNTLKKSELIRFDLLRINRNAKKDCTCKRPTYDLDVPNRRVTCTGCQAILDPFDALVKLAERHEEVNAIQQRMISQVKEMQNQQTAQQLKEIQKGIDRSHG